MKHFYLLKIEFETNRKLTAAEERALYEDAHAQINDPHVRGKRASFRTIIDYGELKKLPIGK